MSTVAPPPTHPPQGGTTKEDISLDDLKDKFWIVVEEELESNHASLSDTCEPLLRELVSAGATRFLKAPSAEQDRAVATQNLRRLMSQMVQVAHAGQQMAAAAGGGRPMTIIDEEVYHATLEKAKREGWTFWPFSW